MKKVVKVILISIALILALLIVAFTITVSNVKKVNESEQDNVELIIGSGEKKALCLYQDAATDTVKKDVDYVSNELVNNNYVVTINHARIDLLYKTSDYEIIILATPVYMGSLSTSIMNFIDNNDFTNNKVFFLVNGKLEEDKEVVEALTHFKATKALKSVKTDGVTDKLKNAFSEFIVL